ncbi:hypothetical protein EDC04DRAFT_241409 [Pisolithus marmoratus]|nr:hypothetical protein EDC04DRAFT_241409 [Pisolithus marmoratus]
MRWGCFLLGRASVASSSFVSGCNTECRPKFRQYSLEKARDGSRWVLATVHLLFKEKPIFHSCSLHNNQAYDRLKFIYRNIHARLEH